MKEDIVATTPPPEGDFTEYLPKRVRLKSADDIFNVMAKCTRLCATGRMTESRYRSIIYGLNNMLNALKVRALEKYQWKDKDKKHPNPLGQVMMYPLNERGEIIPELAEPIDKYVARNPSNEEE